MEIEDLIRRCLAAKAAAPNAVATRVTEEAVLDALEKMEDAEPTFILDGQRVTIKRDVRFKKGGVRKAKRLLGIRRRLPDVELAQLAFATLPPEALDGLFVFEPRLTFQVQRLR
jgi:hypothetical protein